MTVLSELITEIRGYLRDKTDNSNSNLFSDSELIGYINRSINELCFKTDINTRTYVKTYDSTAISSLSDASIIPILDITDNVETGIFEISSILIKPNNGATGDWYDLKLASPRDLRYYEDASDVLCAEYYDDALHLNIDINEDDILALNARFMKTKLANTGDTYPLDIACENATVAYAVGFGMYKKGQFEAGDRWRVEYENRLNEIKKRIENKKTYKQPDGLSLSKGYIDLSRYSSLSGRTIPNA